MNVELSRTIDKDLLPVEIQNDPLLRSKESPQLHDRRIIPVNTCRRFGNIYVLCADIERNVTTGGETSVREGRLENDSLRYAQG